MKKKAATCSEEEKKELLKMSEISISLDTYDDIFSDFDPRPYSERALSDDFIYEAKKASREKKTGKIELSFLIPKDKQNIEEEKVIIERLRYHFTKHHKILEKEINSIRIKSIASILVGFAMMLTATYISTTMDKDLLLNMAFVILEPTGWFITWFSLDNIFYTEKRKKEDRGFYQKMANAEITFTPY